MPEIKQKRLLGDHIKLCVRDPSILLDGKGNDIYKYFLPSAGPIFIYFIIDYGSKIHE
jgi:hypothetical protein